MPIPTRPPTPTAAAVLFALALLVGCADDRSNASDVAVVRDSAGVTIVENSPEAAARLPEWRITDELMPPIGDTDSEGPRSLYRVAGAVRLSGGGVAVANGGTGEIRIFDARGAHSASYGRSGSGPGEFRSISHFARLPGDSLVVFDGGQRRVSVLHPASGFVRELTLSGDAGSVVAVLPDGALIASTSLGGLQPTDGMVRAVDELRLLSGTGERLGALGQHAARERTVSVSPQGTILLTPPFARRTMYASFGEGYVVADQAHPEYRLYTRDGTLRRIVRTGGAVRSVTPADLDAHIERVLVRAPPEGRASIREGLETMQLPLHLPAFGEVRVGRDSTVWVADFPEPGTERSRWTLFAPNGEAIARVELPDRSVMFDAGADWVLFLGRNELDVEAVHLTRLRRERPD